MSESTTKDSNLPLWPPLETPVQYCPGVGPQRAQLLLKLGIKTVTDLLFHIPHSVNDFSDRIVAAVCH